MIGKKLGPHQIASQLGKGGMGEVYLADDLVLNRKAALKLLPEVVAANPEKMARFERGANLRATQIATAFPPLLPGPAAQNEPGILERRMSHDS
jgi:serine/threonine protein kinase